MVRKDHVAGASLVDRRTQRRDWARLHEVLERGLSEMVARGCGQSTTHTTRVTGTRRAATRHFVWETDQHGDWGLGDSVAPSLRRLSRGHILWIRWYNHSPPRDSGVQ